jgi:hypothetical protein
VSAAVKHNVASLSQQKHKIFFICRASLASQITLFHSFLRCSITGSPKTTRKLAATGIGHHINPLQNPYPNQQKQPTQQSGGMPQYGGGSEKCARCLKPVYLAEKKVGAGKVSNSINY